THWYFTPQDFGRSSGEWLDFPDVAQTTTHLWCAANMFDALGLHTGSVVWRIPLAQLAIGSTVAFEYWRDTAIGAHSYRFAAEPTSGVGSRMFLAAHVDTATVRVYAHDV